MNSKRPPGKVITIQQKTSTDKGILLMPVRGTLMKSPCCDSDHAVFVLPNSEVQILCAQCHEYIGHLAPRYYALLYQGIPSSINKIMKDQGYIGTLSIKALEEIEKIYAVRLVESAEPLLEAIIKEHLRGGDDIGERPADDGTGSGEAECECENSLQVEENEETSS